ncbi:MAG: asparagine synthase (glutamine-hydrolyzing) [Actinomycetota bacterium]|nr:asparagine synthase (glutamine-hydrolyzing) [Actinomycetota bacterium]MCL6094127.1 asparagine synthase (glutamine-hydrolyzing) [Actinomycetota bacterium]MDA8166751.1 asparagine synthase (glutamine-hydrolyzing) [Actinomycetota bacterium]
MCGITGTVSTRALSDAAVKRVERMADILRHRGPDDHGLRRGGNYALAHRRLSIIDLEGGHQPMCNETGTVWIVFNGEIYNFPELHDELVARGHSFRTRCDTEVIIHLYEEYGSACVSRLNGMFAFAIYDEEQKQLFLARDRAGIKPLYYICNGSSLSFASEAKALVMTAERLIGPDPRSVVDFFALSLVQEDRTAFEDVRELRPAHTLTWDVGRKSPPRPERYWQLSYSHKLALEGPELAAAVSDLLEDAVRIHLISDVPVGTYLSGGLDSSLISAIADNYLPELNTFSAGFVGKEMLDERPFAREAAQMIGSKHHEVEVGPDGFLGNLRRIIWHMDEPTLSPGVYPYYFLCGLVADSVKVVLGGQGSDELFGGYPRYRMALLENDMRLSLKRLRLPRLAAGAMEYRRRYGLGGLKNEVLRLNAPNDRRIYEIVSGFHPRRLPALFSAGFRKKVAGYDPLMTFHRSLEECDSDNLIDRMLYNDFRNMLASILRTEDRMSMAHSIESRVPFLDYRLIELAASIPPKAKVRGDEPKLILKEVARGRVPDSIVARRKQGFTAPIESWFMGSLGGEIRDLLLSDRALARGIFDRTEVGRLIGRAFGKKKDIWRVWSLVTFETWCRIFADGEGVSGQD